MRAISAWCGQYQATKYKAVTSAKPSRFAAIRDLRDGRGHRVRNGTGTRKAQSMRLVTVAAIMAPQRASHAYTRAGLAAYTPRTNAYNAATAPSAAGVSMRAMRLK